MEKIRRRALSGMLVVAMLLTTMMGNISLAYEGEAKEATKHRVILETADGGTLTFEGMQEQQQLFEKGEEVVVKAEPESGFVLSKLSANGKTTGTLQAIKTEGDGKSTFVMPDEDVRVKAEFMAEPATVKETEGQQEEKPDDPAMEDTGSDSVASDPVVDKEGSREETGSKEEAARNVKGEPDKEKQDGKEAKETKAVEVATSTNCTIYLNDEAGKIESAPGEEVTVEVKAYGKIDLVVAINENDEEIKLTEQGNGTYTFTMPDEKVLVSAVAGTEVNTWMARAAKKYTITTSELRYTETNPNGTLITGEYLEVDDSIPAFCVQHFLEAPAVGTKFSIKETYTASNKKNETMRKVLYYGWKGPKDLGVGYQTTRLACSVANGWPDSAWEVGRKFIERVSSLAAPPASFKVHVLTCGISGVQNVAIREYTPEGYAKLKKSSANTSATNNNDCYSLKGAQYGVYKEKSCKNKVGTLTTKENGETNSLKLNEGIYYVKETKAPKGYALDKTVYTVKVQSGKTATVKVKDTPQSDPIPMLLGKYDGEKKYNGEANLPQGSASLAGAEFTVKFYGGQYDTVEELEGKKPLRSWTFKTNKNGFAYFSEEYLVKGDEFWEIVNGSPTLPLGTITIQETKAPEGYNINDEIFIRQITSKGAIETVNTYNMPKIPEDVIRGDLEIIKVYQPDDDMADTLQGIEGVEFTLTSKTTGEEVMRIITDKEGKATTKSEDHPRGSLPFDTYIVEEVKAPEGYRPIKPFEVTIKEEGVVLSGIYKQDTLITSPVQIVKVDAETGKVVPRAGAKFQLLDKDKKVITMTNRYPAVEEMDTFVTDEKGQFVFPEALKVGTYYLREVKAPEGYLLNKEDLKFTVTEEMDGTDWTNPLVIKFADESVKGQIEISKYEKDGSTFLPEAVFEIRAAEDIVTGEGTVRLKKGEVADYVETEKDGTAKSNELFLGKYEVREVEQPNGFVLSDKTYPVELKYKDQNTSIVVGDLTVYNDPTTLVIEKYRKGETDVDLEGVKFKVWGKGVPRDKAEQIYTTDKDGKIIIKYLDKDTFYFIQEIETIPGYVVDDTIHKIYVDRDGFIEGEPIYTIKIENDYTKFDFVKTDITTGKELPGAQMKVTEKGSGEVIDSWTSTTEPHRITDLVVDKTYILEEVLAPEGYLQAKKVEFTVPSSGEVQKVEMEDELAMGQIKIHKKDADHDKKLITGAVFEIRAAEDIVTGDGTVRLKKGDLADTVTTKEGEAISKELFLGKYTVQETKQAPGYVLDETIYETELTYKDQLTELVYGDVTVVNDVTELIVEKYEKGTEDVRLSGVEFTFWTKAGGKLEPDENRDVPEALIPGVVVQEEEEQETFTLVTDEEGKILLDYLQPDTTYYFKETKTLEGYVLDDTIHEVYVGADGKIDGKVSFVYRVENDYTKLYISKQEIGGKELPGADLKLERVDGGEVFLIEEWTSTDEPHYFEKLKPGEYILTEVQSPAGYKVAESMKFTVEESGEVQKVVMVDEKKEGLVKTSTPDNFRNGSAAARTGDMQTILPYLVALLVALFSGGTAVFLKLAVKEKKEQEEQNEA